MSEPKKKARVDTLYHRKAAVREVLSLFDKDDCFTEEAMKLCEDARKVLMPLVEEALKSGFPIREVIHLLKWAAMDIELDVLVGIIDLKQRETEDGDAG